MYLINTCIHLFVDFKMQPYYYRIKHLRTGMIYVGSQYGKNANPSLFFVKYFTSSHKIRQIIMEEGKQAFVIEKIHPCNNARNYEERVLRYWYNKLGRHVFVTTFINQCVSPGTQLSPQQLADIACNNTNVRGKAWWNDGKNMRRSVECPGEGWVKGALKHSEETIRKRSESNKGKTRTEEQKRKYSESRNKLGHKGSHKGTVWVIDGSGKRKRIVKE